MSGSGSAGTVRATETARTDQFGFFTSSCGGKTGELPTRRPSAGCTADCSGVPIAGAGVAVIAAVGFGIGTAVFWW
jgi:hypothetical protein